MKLITLTLNCSFEAGNYQIFYGGGSYNGEPKIKHCIPQWFGADSEDNSSIDSRDGIQQALDFFEVVFFPKGKYYIGGRLIIKQRAVLTGTGASNSIICTLDSFNDYNMLQNFETNTDQLGAEENAGTAYTFQIENLRFHVSDSVTNTVSTINMVHPQEGSVIRDCFLSGGASYRGRHAIKFQSGGIAISNSVNVVLIDNVVCYGEWNEEQIYVNASGNGLQINKFTAAKSRKAAIHVENIVSVLIDDCHIERCSYLTQGECGIYLNNVSGVTIRNAKIFNSNTTPLPEETPAIRIESIGTYAYQKDYQFENIIFTASGLSGNFAVQIEDNIMNRSIKVHRVLLRYNRVEIVDQENGLTVFNRSSKLQSEYSFTTTTPLPIPYILDTGNHSAEVEITGKAFYIGGSNIGPFVCRIMLANLDNGNQIHDAEITYSMNAPAALSLVYNTTDKQYELHLGDGGSNGVAVNSLQMHIKGNLKESSYVNLDGESFPYSP